MNLRTPAATKAVGAVSLLLLAALGWLLLVGPAWSAIGEADEARAAAEDSNLLLTTQLADLRTEASDLTRTTQSAAELATIFPATADQPGFFAAVTEAAASAGIDASAIDALSPSVPTLVTDPSADPSGDPAVSTTDTAAEPTPDPTTDPTTTGTTTAVDPNALAVQTVSMTVTAPYDELQELLANLETMPRALVVSGVTITEGEDGALTLALEGATFVAPPLVEPDVAVSIPAASDPSDASDSAETAETAPGGDSGQEGRG